jgi:hypothetical protein
VVSPIPPGVPEEGASSSGALQRAGAGSDRKPIGKLDAKKTLDAARDRSLPPRARIDAVKPGAPALSSIWVSATLEYLTAFLDAAQSHSAERLPS